MNDEELEKWILAGKIGKEIREYAISLVKPGVKIIDIAKSVDARFLEYKARPAFPINISVNNIAAHYHPIKDDGSVLKIGDIVKIDVGASIDGYLSDTAATVLVGGGDNSLIKTSKEALDAVIDSIKPGMEIDKISSLIEDMIRKNGLKPIVNLGGHGIGRYNLHAYDFIPNVNQNTHKNLIKEGVIAVEPFVTDGVGYVIDDANVNILMLDHYKPVRDVNARKVLEFIKNEYHELPFARRWIDETFGPISEYALRLLVSMGILYEFHVLKEESGANVAQFEHTILFHDGEVIVTTL